MREDDISKLVTDGWGHPFNLASRADVAVKAPASLLLRFPVTFWCGPAVQMARISLDGAMTWFTLRPMRPPNQASAGNGAGALVCYVLAQDRAVPDWRR